MRPFDIVVLDYVLTVSVTSQFYIKKFITLAKARLKNFVQHGFKKKSIPSKKSKNIEK